MILPFSHGEFLDVFAAFNKSFWPFVVLLWLATAAVVVVFGKANRPHHRLIAGLLAIHWAWAGLAYQAWMFTTINPVAWLFAALFLVQALLFAWFAIAGRGLVFSRGRSTRHTVAWALIVYALLYPGLVWAGGLTYPRMPTFGVPCPTTILTAGFLLAADSSLLVMLTLVPLLWTIVGGSAAFLLGVHADLILPLAGVSLVAVTAHNLLAKKVAS